MNELTPLQAALISRGVYLLREDSVGTLQERGSSLNCEGMFEVSDTSRFEGISGSMLWKQLSGFGYIAAGTGRYQGDVLVVTRGTATRLDWLSNINIGMQLGPGGQMVHAGFHEVWKSFQASIREFIQGKNPTCIHCVGHSLGGALAALNADYLSTIGVGQVKLYTFGSPRAGSFLFSRTLTRRIGSDNIYRVSHPSDPVPMIPLFPFQHLPYDVEGRVVSNNYSGLINSDAHNMVNSYIPGVSGKSWHDLLVPTEPDSDFRIKAWLEQSTQSWSGFKQGSAKLLSMIGRALMWILKRSKDVLVGSIGIVLCQSATLLDQLAWLIGKAVAFSEEVAGYVRTLINAIFRFLGRAVSTAESITVVFLRWVLGLLFTTVAVLATNALSFPISI